MAGALSQMATLWTWTGEPERGCSYSLEAFSILHDLGMPMWLAVEQCASGSEPYLHSGRYAEANELVNEGLAIAQSQRTPWSTGAGLVRLAKLAMARADYVDVIALLEESLPILRSIERVDELGDALIALATSLIRNGEGKKGTAFLIEGKRIAVDIGHSALLCHGIAAEASLALALGDVEQAVERYAVAESQPFVANSVWFGDVYGKKIEEAKALLEADVITEVEERGRQWELRTVVEEIMFGAA